MTPRTVFLPLLLPLPVVPFLPVPLFPVQVGAKSEQLLPTLPANTTGYTGMDDPRVPDWVKKRGAELDAAKKKATEPTELAKAGAAWSDFFHKVTTNLEGATKKQLSYTKEHLRADTGLDKR